jgi:hypothetical protein
VELDDLIYRPVIDKDSWKYLYRCMNKHELYSLLSGEIVESAEMHYGFSFSKNRIYSIKQYKEILKYPEPSIGENDDDSFTYDFLVTFNRSVMEDNFPMTEIKYTPKWFANHIKIAFNYLGYEPEEVFYTGSSAYFITVLEFLYHDYDFSNINNGEAYSIILNNHIDDPVLIEEFPNLVGLKFSDISTTSFMSEVLLEQNTYHFISGMINNVESFYPELLNELYNFLKDKL